MADYFDPAPEAVSHNDQKSTVNGDRIYDVFYNVHDNIIEPNVVLLYYYFYVMRKRETH